MAGFVTVEATQAPTAASASVLPTLRQDLSIYKGPPNSSGAPTYTLHDPPSNKYFRIGWAEFEILSRWPRGSSADEIARQVSEETTLFVETDKVEAFANFLHQNNLLQVSNAPEIKRMALLKESNRPSAAMRLLRNHLFIRIPVLQPDRLLKFLRPVADVAASRAFLTITGIVAILGVYLAGRQWDHFMETMVTLFNWSSILLIAVTVAVVKILHEFGHALTAHRFGCRVPTMGLSFMVFWPILYTDTIDAWKLPSKAQRLKISGAGIGVELMIAAYATLAWSFLPQGPLQGAAFLIATTTWVLSLLVNLNPFMRFDGYFLLSDLLAVENLQTRSFLLAKWRLREALFGFGDPPPENWGPGKRRLLLAYAYLTWIYRAALYLGIALLIYHFLFKLAGLVLFFLEIGWLIGTPIAREVRYCYGRIGTHSLNRQVVTTLLLIVVVIGALVTPWTTHVTVPALLRPAVQNIVYAPVAARVETVSVKLGDRVDAGAVLANLRSKDLENLIELAQLRSDALERRRAFEGFDSERRQFRLIVEQKLQQSLAELTRLRDRLKELEIVTPIKGKIIEISEDFRAGEWVAEGEQMLIIAQTGHAIIEAYIPEDELRRVNVGAAVTFTPENLDIAPISGVVASVDRTAAPYIDSAYFASKYGGGIPVNDNQNGNLSPTTAHYRTKISIPELVINSRAELSQILRGDMAIEAPRKNILRRVWTTILTVIIRESGF